MALEDGPVASVDRLLGGRSNDILIGGPGGGKAVVCLDSSATRALAAATPGPPPPPEVLDLLDDPHPAARSDDRPGG